MFIQSMRFFLAVPILVLAIICTPDIASAYTVNDTFTDIVGQGEDPGNITLVDEHGGASENPDPYWAANDSDVLVGTSWGINDGADLGLTITNLSDHTMWDTVLAFEQFDIFPGFFPDWLAILEPDTWDGVDGDGDPSYWFGDIAPGASSSIVIVDLKDSYISPPAFAYDSQGLDSAGFESTVSVTHAVMVPEPISSSLFIIGGATLGFRRFRKKRIS